MRHNRLRLLWVLAVALVVAEVIARIVTWMAWRAPLAQHPDIARILAESTGAMKVLTIDGVLNPKRFPAAVPTKKPGGGSGAPTWTTFDHYPEGAFPAPPKHEQTAPGVVRIVFVGGSTTYDGHPALVASRMDQRFGAGKVEVINMGVSSSSSYTTLLMMTSYLPRWKPHIVVFYEGFNDLMVTHALSLAGIESLRHPGTTSYDFEVPPRSQGLWSLLWPRAASPAELPWFRQRIFLEPMENYWSMSRMAWRLGFDFYVSTFAAPDYARLPPKDLDELETNLRYLWPLLGTTARYAAELAEYNRHVTAFAAASGAGLIDVAGLLRGGMERFTDNCHMTALGRDEHAAIVFAALAPRVAELLAQHAPAPAAPATITATSPLPIPAGGLPPQHPRDGSCVRGPCPQGACFVPGGATKFGYPDDVVAQRVRPREQAALGWWHEQWFADEGPQVEVYVSPFCVDRTEATVAAATRCSDARVCPRVPKTNGDPDRAPAIFPTGQEAALFCAFRGGRLPTEAEFEAAARGPTGPIQPWGDAPWTGSQANFCGRECRFGLRSDPDDGFAGAAPVGSFANQSPYGAVDMAGNQWEWVADSFVDAAHRLAAGKRDPLFESRDTWHYFLRGGGFGSYAHLLERRNAEGLPDVVVASRGARCVYDFGTVHTRIRSDR